MYNTPATFMCGAILHSLTGKNVFEYLKPRLLEPLGITDYHCEVNTHGLDPAGFGAHLRTEDIAKFGLFLLNRGAWNGKQLLTATWIDEAVSKQADSSNEPSGLEDWTSGYGYQFWLSSPPGVYRCDGRFGQLCIVMPEQDAVVAITAGSSNVPLMLDALWGILLPELKRASSDIKPNPVASKRIGELKVLPPTGSLHPRSGQYSGLLYELSPNILRVTKICITVGEQQSKVAFWRDDKTCTAAVGYGEWIETTTGPDDDGISDIFAEIACAGAWHDDEFHLDLVYTRTPYTDSFVVSPESCPPTPRWPTPPRILRRYGATQSTLRVAEADSGRLRAAQDVCAG